MSQQNTPADHIHVHMLPNGVNVIYMTFGLLNRLSSMVGDLKNLTDIYLVPELQDAIIYELLVTRDELGTPVTPYKLYQFAQNITPAEGEKLLAWCEGHLYDFFMRRLQTAQALQKRMIQHLKG